MMGGYTIVSTGFWGKFFQFFIFYFQIVLNYFLFFVWFDTIFKISLIVKCYFLKINFIFIFYFLFFKYVFKRICLFTYIYIYNFLFLKKYSFRIILILNVCLLCGGSTIVHFSNIFNFYVLSFFHLIIWNFQISFHLKITTWSTIVWFVWAVHYCVQLASWCYFFHFFFETFLLFFAFAKVFSFTFLFD